MTPSLLLRICIYISFVDISIDIRFIHMSINVCFVVDYIVIRLFIPVMEQLRREKIVWIILVISALLESLVRLAIPD